MKLVIVMIGLPKTIPLICNLFTMFKFLIIILLQLLLMKRTLLMPKLMILLCIWTMIIMFEVMVILLSFFMMLLKVIMREGNMVICILIILSFPSLCWESWSCACVAFLCLLHYAYMTCLFTRFLFIGSVLDLKVFLICFWCSLLLQLLFLARASLKLLSPS
jgi:hypothetical protein